MAKSKREIDKDLLYSKIMPSSSLGEEPERAPAAPSNQPQPLPTAAQGQPLLATAQTGGVQLKDRDPTVLVNIMEKLVLEKLDLAFSKFNCCKCDRCKKDVVALALNKLKPKYMVLRPDQPTPIPTSQMNTEVTTALVQAIIVVRTNPRH